MVNYSWDLRSQLSSKLDRTQKLIYVDGDKTAEVSYVNKLDGKDILVMPTQVGCAMSCTFCHITDLEGKVVSLTGDDMAGLVIDAHERLDLMKSRERTLLISFMGCGEPLANTDELAKAMLTIRGYFRKIRNVRFALATIFPRGCFSDFVKLAEMVKEQKLDLKVHLSLHFTDDVQRKEWMPAAEQIKPSLDMLHWYHNYTGNAVEIHYTAIAGENDTMLDAGKLGVLAQGITVKFLHFKEKGSLEATPSQKMNDMADFLVRHGVTVEIYNPPGEDVGSSCGMFLLDEYKTLVQIA